MAMRINSLIQHAQKRSHQRLARRGARAGATTVEFAVIAPIVFLLLIGFAVMALGVYRYQQVGFLARVGARYASTHGAQYRTDHRLPPGTVDDWIEDIRVNGVLPQASVMTPENLLVHVEWEMGSNFPKIPINDDGTEVITNSVTVTVEYQWLPEVFVGRPITLKSHATVAMSY
jgi:Flp pilus assembly protein TadG